LDGRTAARFRVGSGVEDPASTPGMRPCQVSTAWPRLSSPVFPAEQEGEQESKDAHSEQRNGDNDPDQYINQQEGDNINYHGVAKLGLNIWIPVCKVTKNI